MRVLVLGGGISGLTAAYYLSLVPGVEVTVLEKSMRWGGAITTDKTSGYHFELGPHTFRSTPDFLQMVYEMDLQDQMIGSDRCNTSRYLLHEGKLERLPRGPLEFFTSPLFRGHRLSLLRERKCPVVEEEETVHRFIERRLGKGIADTIFSAMGEGVYAGDIECLSSRACFPKLKRWELQYGSIVRGALRERGKKCHFLKKQLKGSAVFSFRRGIDELVHGVFEKIDGVKLTNCAVEGVHCGEESVEVHAGGKTFQGDYVFSALPCGVIGGLLQEKEIGDVLQGIVCRDLTSVCIGYAQEVLPVKGFGFLAPKREGASVSGVVFDSHVFPQQNQREKETRLTVMMRGKESNETAIARALGGVKNYLGVDHSPDAIKVAHWTNAIPQYHVGHLDRIAFVEKRMKEKMPRALLVGNYLRGVGVADCMAQARGCVEKWRATIGR